MKIEHISRVNNNSIRDSVNDIMFLIESVTNREIDIHDEYTISVLQKNKDVVYHVALLLSRLNVVASHTVSEIRSALIKGVTFSEKDYQEDLIGYEVKRSKKMQKTVNGKYTTYYWNISNLGTKRSDLIWEITHEGRKWTANIPKHVFIGKNSLSIACDPNTGEPKSSSSLSQYFEETTGK